VVIMKAYETTTSTSGLDLDEVPVGMIHELLDELESGAWSEAEGIRLLLTLQRDRRPAARVAVAEAIGRMVHTLTVTEAVRILHAMSDDHDPEVREAVAQALAAWLEQCDELWQIVVVEQWAASPMRLTRQTLARAFSFPFVSLVADVVLEQLALDPTPWVRLETTRSIGARFGEDPEGFGALLRQLAADPSAKVQSEAQRCLKLALPL
jgi:hypothetical protein